tara:strand:+ start:525 stop:1598 length:1074 start_codon:yes stop_codon:yes gene_type:complete
MAITSIEADIQNITGVADANSQFIISAQKFLVSSIPKNLLKWASTETVPSTHGGDNDPQQVTLPVGTDNIISVRRDSFPAMEVSVEERGFIDNSSSLKKATSVFPKYYIADGNRIIAKPDPDNTYKIYVMYIDFSKLDDDSDLRNIVINYAISKEFTALAASSTFPTLTWPNEVPPSTPSNPNFTTPDVASVTAPVFNQPVMSDLDFTDTNTWISTEEDSEMLSARVQEIQTKISEYSALLQSSQVEFTKNNSEYQGLIQEAQQEASLLLNQESQEYSAQLQKYQSELQDYQARINETVQINQGQVAQWQAENGIKLNHYVQLAAQYYNWATTEIKNYIENNPKTLDKVMEMQKGRN